MKLHEVELRRISVPLRHPFRTSYSVSRTRDILLVRVRCGESDGWGECVAGEDPYFSAEYVDGAHDVMRRHLIPRLFAAGDQLMAAGVTSVLGRVSGHRMAKAALEMAVLDAELRNHGVPLSRYLGAVREAVPAGVSVGIMDSVAELLRAIDDYLADGYVRVKLKIQPGWDLVPVRAVREQHPDIPLQVDANTAYQPSDTDHLRRLDEFDLTLIEQPFPADDLVGHAELARRLGTPISLDESITSARTAAQAIALGACSLVNIKAGRVGGYLEARRIHDVCAALGVPVWCGGMLETGIGRAANLALAALPNFQLPGDVSASDRYWRRDIITEPFTLAAGHLDVPTSPGLGVDPDTSAIRDYTTGVERLSA